MLPLVPQENNLAMKAARILQQEFHIEDGAKITIDKHIPTGAGLGGGSSDAAHVLKGLSRLWSIEADETHLRGLARQLGADVPFFLGHGAAIATGIGDQLQYFKHDLQLSVLLVYPQVEVSTAWAYSSLSVSETSKSPTALREVLEKNVHNIANLKSLIRNDFEPVVFESYPALRDIRDQLYRSGALLANMSGSGSTIFGLFESVTGACESALNFPQYRCFVAEII